MRARKSVLDLKLDSSNLEKALQLKERNGKKNQKKKGTFIKPKATSKVIPLATEEQTSTLLQFVSTEAARESPRLKLKKKIDEKEPAASASRKPFMNQPMKYEFEDLKSNQLQMIDDLAFYKEKSEEVKIKNDHTGVWDRLRSTYSSIERSYKLISRLG